ncbi:MAG: ABC transporter ATP-binding protein [Calditrichaceae bacterium]
MNDAALEWRHVAYSVRQGFWMTSKTLLQDISIRVSYNSVVGLIGPNGAGKTTTIKLAAGLIAPESGNVLINGNPSSEAKSRISIGLLTEAQYIYPYLKLGEWLTMMAGLSGMKTRQVQHRIDDLLEQLELKDRKKQTMRSFSKGQLQRAGIAQALLHDPEILILDEPMSGLDPYWRYKITQLILNLKHSGKTILFSSHILADVEKLCDQIVLIKSGQVVWSGSLSQMPRRIKGYEVICRAERADDLLSMLGDIELQRLAEKEWLFTIGVDQKQAIMDKLATSRVSLESLRPIKEEIEEVLFGFSK